MQPSQAAINDESPKAYSLTDMPLAANSPGFTIVRVSETGERVGQAVG
jgi:hypothetical protein